MSRASGAALRQGPLAGIRIVEFAGLGPAPLAGMILADLGADVVVVDRPDRDAIHRFVPAPFELSERGKRRVELDLKRPGDVERAMTLLERADGLLEGHRPGVMERLGLGPGPVLARRPSLVYVRITGWGQDGPRAATAGHDIAYLAVTGALHAIGSAETPTPPVNFLGDYAGGTLFGVIGLLAALLEARRSGRGQVVDVAMTEGVGVILTPLLGLLAAGAWEDRREANLLDGGAPFYAVYRTRDDRFLAVGALEDRFFEQLIRGLELDPGLVATRWDRTTWPALRRAVAERVATRTRDEWTATFAGTDACVAPVLSLAEAPDDPQAAARAAFVDVGGIPQPAPAPRFDRTPARPPTPPVSEPVEVEAVVQRWSQPV